MRTILAVALLASCAGSPAAPATPTRPAMPAPLRGPYLGQIATDKPQLFSAGIVSTSHQELNAAFSPAGDELLFTLADAMRTEYTLLRIVRDASGTWGQPAVAPFSGRYSDADPVFTGDGSRVYFISQRPAPGAGPSPRKDFDIWYVERNAGNYGEPVRLPAPVNTDADEFYVSLTRTGSIYFSRNDDIQRAIPAGDSFTVEPLGPAINGPKSAEFDPFVAPDESYLLFTSAGRPDSLGRGDLYVSFQTAGAWQPARSLGPAINTKYFEYCPIVSPDGSHFFFTSYKKSEASPGTPRTLEQLIGTYDSVDNGLGNVYWLKADFLEAMRAAGAPPLE
jgi:Tol biopolymer transport system component